MSGSYATEHADALALIEEAGDDAIVTHQERTYTAATDTMTEAPMAIYGHAVEVKGDPERYEGLGLVERRPKTLVFVSEFYGVDDAPSVGDVIEWAGGDWAIKDVGNVGPDGTPIVSRLVVVQ